MVSIGNTARPDEPTDIDNRIMHAVETCARDFGIDRVTIAEVARRARVSRPTVYRRWPDVHALLSAVFTRRVVDIVQEAPGGNADREAIVERSVGAVAQLRNDPLLSAVLRGAPELALRYISERLGPGQLQLIEILAEDLKVAQRGGTVRTGDTRQMAAMMMLIQQAGVQAARMVEPILDQAALDVQLSLVLDRYLM